MTEAELELARRLVAHPRWKWMEGMLGQYAGRVSFVHDDGKITIDDYDSKTHQLEVVAPASLEAPDLSDAATQGCLWAMLDEFSPNFFVSEHGVEFCADIGDERRELMRAATKGEALARALLAAWGEA